MRKVGENNAEQKKHPHEKLLRRLPLGLLTEFESETNSRHTKLKKSLRYLLPLQKQVNALSKEIAMIDQHMKEGTPVPNLEGTPYDEYHRLSDLKNKIQAKINSARKNDEIVEYEEYSELKTAIAKAKGHAISSTNDIPPEISVDLFMIFIDIAMPAVSESISKAEEDISTQAESHDSLIHQQVISDEHFQDYLYDSKNSLIDQVSQANLLFSRKLYTKSLEPLTEAISKIEEEARWVRDYIYENRYKIDDTLYVAAYRYQIELQVKVNVLKHTQEYLMSKTPSAMQEEKKQRRDSIRIQKSEDRKLDSDSQPSSPAATRAKLPHNPAVTNAKLPLLRRVSAALLGRKTPTSSESSSPSESPIGSPATAHKRRTPAVEGYKEAAKNLKEELPQAESTPESTNSLETPPSSPKGGQG